MNIPHRLTVAATSLMLFLAFPIPVSAQRAPLNPGIQVPSRREPATPRRNPREAIGGAVEQGYDLNQQANRIKQWPEPNRNMWSVDQQRKQEWLREQEQRRAMQEQQRLFDQRWGVAGSTPRTMPPSASQGRKQQEWERQHELRQNTLRQHNMPPLPPWTNR
jgi:hypothetical protein